MRREKPMICPYCGSEIDGSRAFCTNCGAKLPEPAAPQASEVLDPPQTFAGDFQAPQEVAPVQSPAPGSQGYQQSPQYAAGPSIVGMPSTTTAIVLIVIGFLCGIIWGIIGAIQYGPMKQAIDAGDVETAASKFNIIRTVTIIGIVLNVFVITFNFFD